MAKDKAGTVESGIGQEDFFTDKWEVWNEDERREYVTNLRSVQATADRNNTEKTQRLKAVEAERDTFRDDLAISKSKEGKTLEDLRDDFAAVKAEREVIKRQTRLLDRAITGEIDPKLAVQFGRLGDEADAAFDTLEAEIERKVKAGIQGRLIDTAHNPIKGDDTSGLTWERISHMDDQERARIPQQVQNRLFEGWLKTNGK